MLPTLSDDEKRALIESRLRAFALDAYGHELNKQVAIAAEDSDAVVLADAALAAIAVASSTYETELAALPVADTPQEP